MNTKMEIQEYQEKASRTLADLKKPQMDDIHMVLGMVTETGEIADIYKKDIAYGKSADWDHVQEEVGDLMWYIANLCNLHQWDLRDIMQKNIDKLSVRYPDRFAEDKALNRDLDAENSVIYGTL